MPSIEVIDADTHVIESEATWSTFDQEPSLSSLRPQLIKTTDRLNGMELSRWIIGGRLVPRPDGKGAGHLGTPPSDLAASAAHYGVPWEFRSLANPLGRADDAERFGVGTQVMYPTIFIHHLTDDVDLNVALCRSYNRFMAASWDAAKDRFRWVLVPPMLSVEATIEEMRFAKDHGAVGIMFHGIEGDRSVAEPYFDPIYDEAQRLNLSICFHTGPGCRPLLEMADNRIMRNFGQSAVLLQVAFHDLHTNRIPQNFPLLRFGFFEASASWVPFLMHYLRRQAKRAKEDLSLYGPEFFRTNRMFVACEVDEDIPYLEACMGPDHLLLGTDYGHGDSATELDMVTKLRARTDVSEKSARRILVDNPSTFYAMNA